jgi:hypothetical protein
LRNRVINDHAQFRVHEHLERIAAHKNHSTGSSKKGRNRLVILR